MPYQVESSSNFVWTNISLTLTGFPIPVSVSGALILAINGLGGTDTFNVGGVTSLITVITNH